MNLLEQALERTEKYGWQKGGFGLHPGPSCVEGHILRAHGHEARYIEDDEWVDDYGWFSPWDGCRECTRALDALRHAGARGAMQCADDTVMHVWAWNDDLSMPDDEAVYRDTLLLGAKLLDELEWETT